MVFETLVVDVLNRLLGNYFENLDTSQLNLGIWGGNVVLKNLIIKDSAINDLKLPFKIVVGKVGILTMKIPWSKLYTAPTELTLDGLYILIAPSYSIAYDFQAEEEAAWDTKQRQLERIEEAKKREEERRKSNKSLDIEEDTFTEKLVSQIIKNVQIRIQSIHIRYEDDITKPELPFSFGVVLTKLHIFTTDADWNPAIITESVSTVLKKAELDGLSFYWNSDTAIHKALPKQEVPNVLMDSVVHQRDLVFVIGPIKSFAKLQLTPSPDRVEFSKAKFCIKIVMEELAVSLTNSQFQDVMQLAENIDFLARAQFYRKYRPNVEGYRNHLKTWWRFAYTCIVEEEVRRRRQNWDWEHMKRHRVLCNTYAESYFEKLTLIFSRKSIPSSLQAKLIHCEKKLDVFNITILRRQAEMKAEKYKASYVAQEETAKGWFSWADWFSGSSSDKAEGSEAADQIFHRLEAALTKEEKQNLYSAIDYTENALPLDYPRDYEEYILDVELCRVVVNIRDSFSKPNALGVKSVTSKNARNILTLYIHQVHIRLATRPVNRGISAMLEMKSISSLGLENKCAVITSKAREDENLVYVSFELKPINLEVDQKIVVRALPVEMIYQAETVKELIKCFQLPAQLKLNKLQEAAMSTIIEWKEQSTAGIQYMLDTRGEIDLTIEFIAPYILIPQDGVLDENKSILIFDLGRIDVTSVPRKAGNIELLKQSKFHSEEQYVTAVTELAYDLFIIELKDFFVTLTTSPQDYKAVLSKNYENIDSLLKFRQFTLIMEQCILSEDPRFPQLRLQGQIPSFNLDIPEPRLLELVKLLATLPLPQSSGGEANPYEIDQAMHNPNIAESAAISKLTYGGEIVKPTKKKNLVEIIDLMITFRIESIKLQITRINEFNHSMPFADFEVVNIETTVQNKSFSRSLNVDIGGLTCRASQHGIPGESGPLFILKTPMSEGQETRLLKFHIFTVLPNCPVELVGANKQLVKANFSTLDVVLHLEALKSFLSFYEGVLQAMNNELEAREEDLASGDNISMHSLMLASVNRPRKSTQTGQVKQFQSARKALMKKRNNPDDVILEVEAKLQRFSVQLSTQNKNITKFLLGNMELSLKQRPKETDMVFHIKEVHALNLDADSIYKDIFVVKADKVMNVVMKIYDDNTSGENMYNMSKHDVFVKISTGSPRIVYLSQLVDDILRFVNNFQAAKQAMLDASAVAADVAFENVEYAYSASNRISLDILLNAPVVVIPRSKKSSSAFIADFGQLSVTNSFSCVVLNKHDQKIAILDKMKISISNIQIARIVFNLQNQTVLSEVCMLDPPISCKVDVRRNLSSAWYFNIPDFDISGVLQKTFLRCSNEDYSIFMACLSENVNFTQQDKESSVPLPPDLPKVNSLVSNKASEVATLLHSKGSNSRSQNIKHLLPKLRTVVEAPENSDKRMHQKPSDAINIRLNVKIEEVGLVMFLGKLHMDKKKGKVKHDPEMAFANISIFDIEMDLKIYNCGKMNCPIKVQNIKMQDIRNKQTATVHNLIQRRLGNDIVDEGTSVINFEYRVDWNVIPQSAVVSIETTSLTIILCVDYLMMLTEFFTTPAPVEKIVTHKGASKHRNLSEIQTYAAVSESKASFRKMSLSKGDRHSTNGKNTNSDNVASMTCFYNLAKTEVLLIENTRVKQQESNALLLHCEVNIKQTFIADRTNIMGTIGDMKVNTCRFVESENYYSIAEVISPMSITLVMNTSIEEDFYSQMVDINISNVFVRLTAGTLELLTSIIIGLGTNQDMISEKISNVNDYSEMWDLKSNKDSNFWFLKPDITAEVAEEAWLFENMASGEREQGKTKMSQCLILESGSIIVTFETGHGNDTIPVLLLETDIDLQTDDWSTNNMKVMGRMKWEAAYFNPKFGIWEYLIEPVETRHQGKVSHQPWEIIFEYTVKKRDAASAATSNNSDSEDEAQSLSTMCLTLLSNEILELTVTRTALDVLYILSDDFQAVAKQLISKRDVSTAAYTIVNNTGVDVKIVLANEGMEAAFALIKNGIKYDECVLKPGTSIGLGLIEAFDMTKHHNSVLREQEGRSERWLQIEMPDYSFKDIVPVNRAVKRFYPLNIPRNSEEQHNFGLLVDTVVKGCSKVVTIRGIVEVINQLECDVDIYRVGKEKSEAILMTTIVSGEAYNLPMLFTSDGIDLMFAPKGFQVSHIPFNLKCLLKELNKTVNMLSLGSRVEGQKKFYFKIHGEVKQTLHEGTNRKSLTSHCCFLYIKPMLTIMSYLPCKMGYYVDEDHHVSLIENGKSKQITNLLVKNDNYKLHMTIPECFDNCWKCVVEINPNTKDLSSWAFKPMLDFEDDRTITLGIHRDVKDNEVTFYVYVPFWMINRTGLNLIYRGEEKDSKEWEHDPSEPAIMFSFPGKLFFSKKKVQLRARPVDDETKTDWSEKFSLDVAGSGGFVTCRSPSKSYYIGIEIQLSSWGLTRYVFLTPKYYITNQCSFSIKAIERDDHGTWIIEPQKCIPFWPSSSIPHLRVAPSGSKHQTMFFSYDTVHHTLLQLKNKFGAIHVGVHATESQTVITFNEYIRGQAPVLFINATDNCPIHITEKDWDKTFTIEPGHNQLFSWHNPLLERIFLWGHSKNAKAKSMVQDTLVEDGIGHFKACLSDSRINIGASNAKEEKIYYWISFLDGFQRVLLVTHDAELCQYLRAQDTEVALAEYKILLQGLGVSLVDNDNAKEILYLRFASSKVSWEAAKHSKKRKVRWKSFPSAQSDLIESAYQTYLNQRAVSNKTQGSLILDNGMELDFEAMKIVKPELKPLRRNFETGIWLFYKTFPHSMQFHAKFHRVQIDNQLPDSIFPVVLAPVTPPKSISNRATKPFTEISIMQSKTAHSAVLQYKYFKVLIQEFHVKVDIAFLNSLIDMFSSSKDSKAVETVEKYDKEYEEACRNMKSFLAGRVENVGQKHFYDFLHFSPLKIHVSFSMGGSTQLSSSFLNLILASFGVTLTEIHDVIFKLSCLELKHTFLSGDELYQEAYSHYTSQAIKQLYVLVFGLDVLGNPYGLAIGVAEGVEAFFYEPIQGAIQGPGEFAEGLALGVSSLFRSTVGGAAGAFSRITGTIGKGIAALTLDDEYLRKRRENLHQNPNDFAEGFARSGKGLVLGFVEGVTGVVTKPWKGAKSEGFEGFFKGIGKGAVGLIARPTSGVVDFASGSFDAVKKATAATEEARRMRPPRFIPENTALEPYIHHEAEGVQLLNELEKGRFAKTDAYVAHALINPHAIFVLLVTNKRVMYLRKDELFGGWNVEWSYLWEEFAAPPDIVEKGLCFRLKGNIKKSRFFGSSTSKDVVVTIYSTDVCTWLASKIESVMKIEAGVFFDDATGNAGNARGASVTTKNSISKSASEP